MSAPTAMKVPDRIIIDQKSAQSIRDGLARLKNTVMPWSKDGSLPPKFERLSPTGEQYALVDPSLGGFQWPHDADKNKRWAWRVRAGSHTEYGVAESAEAGMVLADAFLLKTGLTVLDE